MTQEAQSRTDAKLQTHEAVCAERYGNILLSMKGMAYRIGRLEMLVWVVAGTVIIGMGGLIVTLSLDWAHRL